ncbi:MAG: polysaccharide biosynthesis/export family protein [Candidatus Zixiibacteriota bacterium]|nr:MAG: polysaccharide biosynthesis/export family protein [candidate division Zixibacteria bacterium]
MNSLLTNQIGPVLLKTMTPLLLALLCFHGGPVFAQNQSDESYRIGAKDILSVTFWQQPDLNTEVRVGEDGMITLPVIGEIRAQGLTTAELSEAIVEQMAFYHTPISQATVTVTGFHSRDVVVTGEVLNPSTLKYEKIPDLWRVILDAGGPTEMADLSKIAIVRKNEKESEIINVDLYSLIKKGDLSRAPDILPGDLINVPISAFGTAIQLGESAKFEGRNIYYVLGSVANPGVRTLDAGIDVLDAIAIAGGFTPDADLENVRVIMKGSGYSNIVKLNLKDYINKGTQPRLVLHPEDTIVVPAKEAGFFRGVAGAVVQVVPVLTAIGTIILLVQ